MSVTNIRSAPARSARVTGVDLSTWWTKDRLAQALDVNPKTVERLARAGTVQRAHWRASPRDPWRVVYHPDDCARLVTERPGGPPPAFVVPGAGMETIPPGMDTTALARPAPAAGVDLEAFATAVGTAMAHALSQTSQTSQTPARPELLTTWVTLEAASAYLGLSIPFLRKMVRRGTLLHVVDRVGDKRIVKVLARDVRSAEREPHD